MSTQSDLLIVTSSGWYCPQAGVYVDPTRKVDRAIVTHAHADHARPGHGHYLCSKKSEPLLRLRLGRNIRAQALDWGQSVNINGVNVSLHPAGHMLGSAQVRFSYKGEVWVITGDYKVEKDGLTDAFEPIRCNTFITETTFALPIYRWQSQKQVYRDMHTWWRHHRQLGIPVVLTAYSLGKAQRLIHALGREGYKLVVHDTIHKANRVIRNEIVDLPETERLSARLKPEALKDALIICPPGALRAEGARQLNQAVVGAASGWMAIKNGRKRGKIHRGFVLSDHVDWPGLTQTIWETGADRVIAMHGYTDALVRWVREQGLQAQTERELLSRSAVAITQGS